MTAAIAADPVGTYRVEGNNPGGGSGYSGSVTVERTGETCRVTWVIGSQRFVGTGVGNKDFLAVSYRSGNQSGLALYGEDGSTARGSGPSAMVASSTARFGSAASSDFRLGDSARRVCSHLN